MYGSAMLKADCHQTRFLMEKTGYSQLSGTKKKGVIESKRLSLALLAKEKWCCDRATD